MATQTYRFVDMDGGAFVGEYDYDDATLRVLTIRVVNTGARVYTVDATAVANGRTYNVSVQPGASISQPVPQTVQDRLQITVRNGRLEGVSWSCY